MADHSMMKLGKQHARHDPRTLLLAKYLKGDELPPAPKLASWTGKIKKWPMMLNDKISDCTCAARAT